MEPVLDLITSYESRISTVEELISTAYQTTIASDGSFGTLADERERLKDSLQKMLAKNCSLRKKDFNLLIKRNLSDFDRERREIEEERIQVKQKVKEYLDEQKELANCLRQQLIELAHEKADLRGLEAVISSIKNTYQDAGQHLFNILRNFQLHLESFQMKHEEINGELQKLVDKGESLKIEDMKQLEASTGVQDRKAEREARRKEVENLLANFRRQRQDSYRH
jgi:DNA repair exonuclease SbcCD ATPase subunit